MAAKVTKKSIEGQFVTAEYGWNSSKIVGKIIDVYDYGFVIFTNNTGFTKHNLAKFFGFRNYTSTTHLTNIKVISKEQFLKLTRNKVAADITATKIKRLPIRKTKLKHDVRIIGDKYVFGCGELVLDKEGIKEYLKYIENPISDTLYKTIGKAKKHGYEVTAAQVEQLLTF